MSNAIVYRQKLANVLIVVGELSEVDEISMQRLVVGHAFDSFPHILVVLDRLY